MGSVSEHFPLGRSYGLIASRCFRDDEADETGFLDGFIEVLVTLCGVVDDVAKGEVFRFYPLLPVLTCLHVPRGSHAHVGHLRWQVGEARNGGRAAQVDGERGLLFLCGC